MDENRGFWHVSGYSLTMMRRMPLLTFSFRCTSIFTTHLSAIVQSRCLSLFGHIARMPDETDCVSSYASATECLTCNTGTSCCCFSHCQIMLLKFSFCLIFFAYDLGCIIFPLLLMLLMCTIIVYVTNNDNPYC